MYIRARFTAVCAYMCNYSGMFVCMYGYTFSKIMDQPGKVTNPANSGQLNRENEYFHVELCLYV